MRNLNECKAEIFARSEKRVKDKKRKRRILITGLVACFVPLSICLIILSSMIIPSLLPAPTESDPNSSGYKEAQNPQEPRFESLVIESPNSKSSVMDESLINEIYNSLKELDVSSDDGAVIEPGDGLCYGSVKPVPYTHDADYVITFTFKNSGVLTYSVKGNTLINENTQNEVTLTEAELSELLKSLNP